MLYQVGSTDETEDSAFSVNKHWDDEQDMSSICAELPIEKFSCLVSTINKVFQENMNWDDRKLKIHNILTRTDLATSEVNRYTFYDAEKPYTRNLVSTDGLHYTLLILCWNAGKESKIHNHPCDGCFIKTLRGCIRETLYKTNEETDEIKQINNRFFSENQVSYMSDHIGLHKIGNPNRDIPAVTLHLYTPPFQSCKVRNRMSIKFIWFLSLK